MKRVLWMGIAYGTLMLAQLVCSILFLFISVSPEVKVLVFACLLLASGVMLSATCSLMKKKESRMEPGQRAAFLAAHKQSTLLMAAGAFNLLAFLSGLFFSRIFIIQLVGAGLFAAACVAAGIQVFFASRKAQSEESSDKEQPETPWIEQEILEEGIISRKDRSQEEP